MGIMIETENGLYINETRVLSAGVFGVGGELKRTKEKIVKFPGKIYAGYIAIEYQPKIEVITGDNIVTVRRNEDDCSLDFTDRITDYYDSLTDAKQALRRFAKRTDTLIELEVPDIYINPANVASFYIAIDDGWHVGYAAFGRAQQPELMLCEPVTYNYESENDAKTALRNLVLRVNS